MKPLRWTALALAVLLLVVGIVLWWTLDTRSGARWIASVATNSLNGKLAIREVRGTVSGPLELVGVRYRDPQSGLQVQVGRATLELALRELLAWRLHIQSASADDVTVRLGKSKQEERRPFSLEPPIDIVLDSFKLHGARVERDKAPLLQVRHGELAGRWTATGIALRRLEVDSPQGKISFSGELGGDSGADEAYVGRASGHFNWRLGELTYAGKLKAVGAQRRVTIETQLDAPLAAQLNATLEQRATLPWRFELRVPQFDPRTRLMPESSIASLATTLRGVGDRTVAELRGSITVNGERVRIEPLRVRLQEQTVKIEVLTLIDPRGKGHLNASGEVRLDQEPFFANLAVRWRDVSLPKEWVGQELASRGELQLRGNPSTFNLAGDLALGPPGQLANITLALSGTPREIELQKLFIAQRAGQADVTGKMQLKPAIGWQIVAQATRFDPGAFIVGWPGRLDLNLASQGKLTPQGPDATLDMTRLQGTLRGRAVSGQAALTLNPDKVVAGTLNVRSGSSTIRLTGARGRTMNIVAKFNIATLDDWLPNSAGSLNGSLRIGGRWPRLSIEGSAQGRKLALAESAVDAMDLHVDIDNPLHPEGTLTISASELRVSGFAFTSIALEASGNEQNHRAALVAIGDPASAELRVSGSRQAKGWSGSVEQLTLSATHIAQLTLREPAKVTFAARSFSISESCLAGNEISLCLAVRQDEARNLQASYVLEHLPLALIAAVAKPDLPYRLNGTLEGRGEIRRTADGALFGEAHLASATGGVREADDASETLLGYTNFKLDATLAGDSAQVSTSASLSSGDATSDEGSLQGEITLANLRGPAPNLKGQAAITVDDLAPLALFTPQLAEVAGRGEVRMTFDGTLGEPRIAGSAQIRELAAELPVVGVKLREGELQASMQPNGSIALTGQIKSGSGELKFNGGRSVDGVLRVKLNGENFLAANIPAARVTITPDLELTGTSERMNLGGQVVVPQAKIDLNQLPEGRGPRASPDVVVIDDEAVKESRRVPLYAEITVVLGKGVELVGFGLDAKLSGQLAIRERPGEPTLGSGQIQVAGTYKAYGQDLNIEQGRLLFAATPIDNPQVSLVAVRTLPDVVIKLTATGTARQPLLTVSSDPAMAPTQALSYLVTGKPLNELGSGEGDVVQSATRSLGSAAGNLLAKNLGKRVGVDEIGVENSTEIGGSAFTIGRYLSPRLYLSYGVGLFEPGQVVLLRYRISDKVSLEASQGPLNQRTGVTYKIER